MKLKVNIRTRINKIDDYFLIRELPAEGQIMVQVGQRVVPEDLLGHCEISPGFRVINLSQIFNIDPAKSGSCLLKQVGKKVYRGEMLAQKRSFFGKKELISPVDGEISEFDLKTGNLTIRFFPSSFRMAAGCFGVVDKIEGNKRVMIKTSVLEINGVLGVGKQREGGLKIIGKKDSFLLAQHLDLTAQGMILVGGGLLTQDSLQKALALGIEGIISGGMHARDYFAIGGRIKSHKNLEDFGLTVIVLEGFGHVEIGEDIFGFLKQFNGRYCFIEGSEKKIIIPLTENESGEKKKTPVQLLKGSEGLFTQEIRRATEKELAVGDRVRLTGENHFGKQGKVLSIGEKTEVLSSGLKSVLIEVDLGSEKTKVAYQNLEIINEN